MNSRTRLAAVALMASAAVLAGTACSAQETQPVDTTAVQPVNGAALGAAVGALIAIQGQNGAAVGAAVGTVVGAQVGSTQGK